MHLLPLDKTTHQKARGLGWFSVLLGLSELLAAKRYAKALGTARSRDLIRGFGLREVTTGLSILAGNTPHPAALWARVAGDVLDLAALRAALDSRGADRPKVGGVMVSILAITALDVWCAWRLSSKGK